MTISRFNPTTPKFALAFDPTGSDETHGLLLCPLCGGTYVHIDEAHIDGRPVEDGDHVNVIVDSTGRVEQHVSSGLMAKPKPYGGQRRHTVSLVGTCEMCGGKLAFGFEQHKGQTFVSVAANTWVATTPKN